MSNYTYGESQEPDYLGNMGAAYAALGLEMPELRVEVVDGESIVREVKGKNEQAR
jgi:hypothetical protein